MSKRDDLALVVRLACLTEDRSNAEQLALLRVADEVDQAFNRAVGTNPGWSEREPSRLYEHAQETRSIDPSAGQRAVDLPRRKGWPRHPATGDLPAEAKAGR